MMMIWDQRKNDKHNNQHQSNIIHTQFQIQPISSRFSPWLLATITMLCLLRAALRADWRRGDGGPSKSICEPATESVNFRGAAAVFGPQWNTSCIEVDIRFWAFSMQKCFMFEFIVSKIVNIFVCFCLLSMWNEQEEREREELGEKSQ